MIKLSRDTGAGVIAIVVGFAILFSVANYTVQGELSATTVQNIVTIPQKLTEVVVAHLPGCNDAMTNPGGMWFMSEQCGLSSILLFFNLSAVEFFLIGVLLVRMYDASVRRMRTSSVRANSGQSGG